MIHLLEAVKESKSFDNIDELFSKCGITNEIKIIVQEELSLQKQNAIVNSFFRIQGGRVANVLSDFLTYGQVVKIKNLLSSKRKQVEGPAATGLRWSDTVEEDKEIMTVKPST